MSSIREYVIAEMGIKFITPSAFDLHEFYAKSSCRTPLVFILSPGMFHFGFLKSLSIKMIPAQGSFYVNFHLLLQAVFPLGSDT